MKTERTFLFSDSKQNEIPLEPSKFWHICALLWLHFERVNFLPKVLCSVWSFKAGNNYRFVAMFKKLIVYIFIAFLLCGVT